jgi:hypothetical protein
MARIPAALRLGLPLALAVGVWSVAGLTAGPDSQTVNRQAAVMAQFEKNIQIYLNVRQKAVSAFQPLKEDADPKAITDREKALGDAIRTARAGVEPGSVFTREVGTLGAGAHRVPIGEHGRLRAGIYAIRLRQGELMATARAVVIR